MVAEEDSDDKTRVGVAPPPQPKLPGNRPADKPAVDDEADHTRIVTAPPTPKLPAQPPPKPAPPPQEAAGDYTQIGGAVPRPPAAPKPPVAPSPPPAVAAPTAPATPPQPAPAAQAPPPQIATPSPAAPPTPAEADQTGDATVVLVQRPKATVRLQRLQPPGRSEVIALDRSAYVIGRSHTCDITLFSPNASREHARLSNREGKWYVEPLHDKSVVVNGTAAAGVTLVTHKMRIQLGGDELLFLDDRAAASASASPATHSSSTPLVITLAVVIALLSVAAIWWFLLK